MKKVFVKYFLLAFCFALAVSVVDAQAKKRTAKKRTTAKKTTNSRTNANITPAAVDTVVATQSKNDSLPIVKTKKSLRPNDAIERNLVKDRNPLAYEHIREDDAVYRERLWREIDIREKQNVAFTDRFQRNFGKVDKVELL